MGEVLLLGALLALPPIEQLAVWVLFYSALFWLPVRGLAALVDHSRARECDEYMNVVPAAAPGDDGYCIGMNILPPM